MLNTQFCMKHEFNSQLLWARVPACPPAWQQTPGSATLSQCGWTVFVLSPAPSPLPDCSTLVLTSLSLSKRDTHTGLSRLRGRCAKASPLYLTQVFLPTVTALSLFTWFIQRKWLCPFKMVQLSKTPKSSYYFFQVQGQEHLFRVKLNSPWCLIKQILHKEDTNSFDRCS